MPESHNHDEKLNMFGAIARSDEIAEDILRLDIDKVLEICPEPKRILVETKDGRLAAVILPYSMFNLTSEISASENLDEIKVIADASLAAGLTTPASEAFRED